MKRFITGATTILGAAALIASPALAAIEVGESAPDFAADGHKDGEAYHFDLGEALAEGPVVLYFFPGANTPGCDIEAQTFAASMDKFEAEGAMVVGATAMIAAKGDRSTSYSGEDANSEEAQAILSEYSETLCDGKFPVMSVGSDTVSAYDVALEMGGMQLANRTSFVIAPDGTVLFTHTEGSPQPHIDLTLQALKDYNATH